MRLSGSILSQNGYTGVTKGGSWGDVGVTRGRRRGDKGVTMGGLGKVKFWQSNPNSETKKHFLRKNHPPLHLRNTHFLLASGYWLLASSLPII